MRRWILPFFLAAALLPAAGLLLAQDGVPDGQPDISGNWVGKLKAKTSEMTTGGGRSNSNLPCELNIAQGGPDLVATLVVTGDEGPEAFNLNGKVGNGVFWLSGDSGFGAPVAIVGKLAGKGSKMKGVGVAVFAAETNEIKLSLKFAENQPE